MYGHVRTSSDVNNTDRGATRMYRRPTRMRINVTAYKLVASLHVAAAYMLQQQQPFLLSPCVEHRKQVHASSAFVSQRLSCL